MKKSIDTINNSEVDFSTGGRKFDLGKTEKLLQEAKKSTNLNKTDEYKELKRLYTMEYMVRYHKTPR